MIVKYNKIVRKIIIVLVLFLLLFPAHLSAANGYKKDIVIKEDGELRRNPNFITLTIEDPNLSDDCILIDKDTKKEIPFYIVKKEKGRIKIRFKLNLDKGEEKHLEFRFSTGEKRSILPEKDFSFVNYIGTEFYGISFEKIYLIALKDSDVNVTNREGKTLFSGKIKYGHFKRIDLASPQSFHIVSTGPLMVTVSSIGKPGKNMPEDRSDDDIMSIIGTEGFFFTHSDIFVTSLFDNNSVRVEDSGGELIYKGTLNAGQTIKKLGLYPSLLYYRADKPVLIQYGKFDDSTFTVIVPYLGFLYGYSFGELGIFSFEDNTNILFKGGSRTEKFNLNSREFKLIEYKGGFEVNADKPILVYSLGKSSNFGGEEIPTLLGYASSTKFNFVTGKISFKYSKGHRRLISVLSQTGDNSVEISGEVIKSIKVTLPPLGIAQGESDKTTSLIDVSSEKPVMVFETSNHTDREIFFNLIPVADKSIIVTIGKTVPVSSTTPVKPQKPSSPKKPELKIPEGVVGKVLWEFRLLPDRFKSFVDNIKILPSLLKLGKLPKISIPISFKLPKIDIVLPEFLIPVMDKINPYLPSFLQGFNFILLILILLLLLILVLVVVRRKKKVGLNVSGGENLIEEAEINPEEIEPKIVKPEENLELSSEETETKEETKSEVEESLEIKPKEEVSLETKPEEIKPEEKEKEKQTIEDLFAFGPETGEVSSKETEEILPSEPSHVQKEIIPPSVAPEEEFDVSILKGRVVLDRKALLRIIELDLFPFLEEAYVTEETIKDLPLKFRTSSKLKSVKLTKFEKSMAEDLGKRVGGSPETGEALALALKLKIDKCIVGEKFNKNFQNIRIISYENLR